MTGAIGKENLIYLVDEIFSSMAGMELTPTPATFHPDKIHGCVMSSVQIVGDWQGAVRVDTDLELARQVCACFLGVDAAGLSPDDIRDAAGELANIIGGSVKTLLAPTGKLSLPTVVMGQNYEVSFLQGNVVQESAFFHESGGMLVSILERKV
jgi:chemotaxis protein CheX